jgi:hypothetical protein
MISHRPATADDRRFVVSAWSSSYKAAHTAGMIHTDDWATVMHRQIERLIARPEVKTIVAFERKDVSFVYGFVCGDPSGPVPIIYYVYTKEPYRRSGHARGLFGAIGIDPVKRFEYTCSTAVISSMRHRLPSARFNPALARYSKDRVNR